MEYSLYHLNKVTDVYDTTISQIINKLNLIGFEVDEIFQESLPTNKFLNNFRLLIEIPSNREDLLNEQLFLQEFGTIFLLDIYNTWKKIESNYQIFLKTSTNNYSIEYINSQIPNIFIYNFEIQNYKNTHSPKWIQQKLTDNGLVFSNNINDILNLIVLEYGITLNANFGQFNMSNLKFVRLVEPEFYINNISNQEQIIPTGSLVLKDSTNKIISVLGILNEIIDDQNTSLRLECIFYDIHENSLLLNTINTKLSFRHLRKMFFKHFKLSLQRLLTILEIYNPLLSITKVSTNITTPIFGKSKEIIKLPKSLLKNILKISSFDETIFKKANLKIIEEDQDFLYFEISPFRKDLKRPIDIIEEYSRFVGYKNFKEILPRKAVIHNSKKLFNYSFIKQFFINYGFNEIYTNSLQDEAHATSIGLQIKIQNPLNNELSNLRLNLFPPLIDVFKLNTKLGFPNCNFFEMGRVFKISNNKIIEQDKISGIFQSTILKHSKQSSFNWFILKGIFENFLLQFGYKDIVAKPFEIEPTYFHPTRSIQFKANNKILGAFGEIHPKFLPSDVSNSTVYLFDFNLNHFKNWRLKSLIKGINVYSKYPSIVKDLSFCVERDINFSILKKEIMLSTKNLKSVNFFDIYFDTVVKDKVNIGLRLEFQSKIETLTNLEIEASLEKIRDLLSKQFNIEFR